MSEAVAVLRILVRGGLATLWPWLILAISFVVNVAFYAAAGDKPEVSRQSGGILSLFLTAVAANQQSWSHVLPFTLGQSGTRRGFLAGMGLFVLAQATLTGVLLTALAGLESRTGGWAVDMRFFRTSVLESLPVVGQFLVLTALMLALSGLGAILGAVLVRWGSTGLWWLTAIVGLLVGALAVGIASGGGWGRAITGLADRPWQQLWVLFPLSVAAMAGCFAWLVARRVALR